MEPAGPGAPEPSVCTPWLPAGTSAARFPRASRFREQVTEEASEGLGGVGGVCGGVVKGARGEGGRKRLWVEGRWKIKLLVPLLLIPSHS